MAEWGSLLGDLARSSAPATETNEPIEWRIHDRTHLEFAIDYPTSDREMQYVWEAYFFAPQSFQLNSDTYDKKAIYEDLHSYVRLAAPNISFSKLASNAPDAPLSWVRDLLAHCGGITADSTHAHGAVRDLRVFASLVRASGLSAMRAMLTRASTYDIDHTRELVASFASDCTAIRSSLQLIVGSASETQLPVTVTVAMRWTDEDVSMVIETLCANAALELTHRLSGTPHANQIVQMLVTCAVAEAKHRVDAGYDTTPSRNATERELEHIEWRRHMLKRFTSSVLWLSLEVRDGAVFVAQSLYAVAAALAMACALLATFGITNASQHVFEYSLLLVMSYAVKDRLKAMLQVRFSRWVSYRFPDRLWTIRDHERGVDIGRVKERAGFRAGSRLPDTVVALRSLTREHPMEADARPESVLWHEKAVTVSPAAGNGRIRSPMLTEIFRLNLRPWLTHADEPKRKIVFADADDGGIYSATARRVYNINVVYRVRKKGEETTWHRIRVVVSRKGIDRIDPIGLPSTHAFRDDSRSDRHSEPASASEIISGEIVPLSQQ